LALQVMETYSRTRERLLLPLLVDGWMLDYKSPAVCGNHQSARRLCCAQSSVSARQ
jgi:hypothetical protein